MTASARGEVLLVAPYIKLGPLQRLLKAVAPGVGVHVVTRWRVDEIAAGVSDLAIWPLLRDRAARLWLHPALHAKYYRADDRVTVGSANLTGLGLGWRPDANLEILVEASPLRIDFAPFEAALWARAIPVDDALYAQFLESAAAFESASPAPPAPPGPALDGVAFEAWRPGLRYPNDLLLYYAGQAEALTAAARETAARDLSVLDPPSGLNGSQLKIWIGARLRLHPEMMAIHDASAQSRRFGEMKALLRDRGADDPGRAWQTWMRWIDLFYPGAYDASEANYSEIFRRHRAASG